ncbi:MAG TPA: acyltransferase [Candidatus Acidoferrum sp.]|nr:acyltransferase [Candidatus Acidoferrum sp.]
MATVVREAHAGAGRIPELDGLRGIAIFIVVLLHYFYRVMAPATPSYQRFQSIFRLGWTGVDLFFVLSGFLIGGILLDARSSPNYFKTFYIRRFFRIIPIYYLWILAYIVLIAAGGSLLRQHMNSHQLPGLGFPVFEHFFFLQNIVVPEYQTIFLYWFGVLWSLAVEEQFYLVAPLVIRFLKRRSVFVLVTIVIIAAPALRVYVRLINPGLHVNPYACTLCRADALCLGVLAALLWREDRFRAWMQRGAVIVYSALTVLGAGMFVLWYKFSDPLVTLTVTVGLSWIAAFYFVLLLTVLAYRESAIARCARAAWLGEFGRVSYCVYVIHFGVSYVAFGLFFRTIPYLSDRRSLLLTLATAAFVYIFARLSWQYFESPLVQLGHRFTYTPRAAIAGPPVAGGATQGVAGL